MSQIIGGPIVGLRNSWHFRTKTLRRGEASRMVLAGLKDQNEGRPHIESQAFSFIIKRCYTYHLTSSCQAVNPNIAPRFQTKSHMITTQLYTSTPFPSALLSCSASGSQRLRWSTNFDDLPIFVLLPSEPLPGSFRGVFLLVCVLRAQWIMTPLVSLWAAKNLRVAS